MDDRKPALLTPEQARTDPAYFNGEISRNRFYDAIRRGDIPSIRLGHKIFIPRARLEAIINGQAA